MDELTDINVLKHGPCGRPSAPCSRSGGRLRLFRHRVFAGAAAALGALCRGAGLGWRFRAFRHDGGCRETKARSRGYDQKEATHELVLLRSSRLPAKSPERDKQSNTLNSPHSLASHARRRALQRRRAKHTFKRVILILSQDGVRSQSVGASVLPLRTQDAG